MRRGLCPDYRQTDWRIKRTDGGGPYVRRRQARRDLRPHVLPDAVRGGQVLVRISQRRSRRTSTIS